MSRIMNLPVFDDRDFPPPHLTLHDLMSRMVQRWTQLSPKQREERLQRDRDRRVPVRFTLTDGDQNQKQRADG